MKAQTTTLTTLRTKLDAVDNQLINILAERFELTCRVGEYKAKHHLPAIDLQREAEQFARIDELSQAKGLNQDFARSFLRLIIDEVVRGHEAIRKDQNHV